MSKTYSSDASNTRQDAHPAFTQRLYGLYVSDEASPIVTHQDRRGGFLRAFEQWMLESMTRVSPLEKRS